jgi:hypothetical protein
VNKELTFLLRARDETSQAFASVQGKMKELEGSTQRYKKETLDSFRAMRGVFTGSVRDVGAMIEQFGMLGRAIGTVTLAAGVFWTAWHTGLKIQQQLWKQFIDSVKENSQDVVDAMKRLGGTIHKAFVEPIAQSALAQKELHKTYMEQEKDLQNTLRLEERRIKAEATLLDISKSTAEKVAAQRELEMIEEQALSRQRMREEGLKKIADAEEKIAELQERWKQAVASGDGQKLAQYRTAYEDATKQLEVMKKEYDAMIKDMTEKDREYAVRKIELQAKIVEATKKEAEEKEKAIREEEQARMKELREIVEQGERIEEIEKRLRKAGEQEAIKAHEGEIEKLDARLELLKSAQAGIVIGKEARKQQRLEQLQAEKDLRRERDLQERIAKGVRLSADEMAWLQQRMIARNIAEIEKAKAQREAELKKMREEIERREFKEMVQALREEKEMLKELLTSKIGA